MLTKAQIAAVRALSDKQERQTSGVYVAEGTKAVGELMTAGATLQQIYALDAWCSAHPQVHAQAVSPREIERMSALKSAPEVLAIIKIPDHTIDYQYITTHLNLALDDIQDPGNVGTIIRLADWFGISDVFCSPATADCYNAKTVQATMGAIARVRVHYVDLPKLLKRVSECGQPIYGTFLEGEPIYGATLSPSGFIVMGNEGRGISETVRRLVTRKLYIPPYPLDCESVESLNVAVATAITCSEFRRR